MARGQRQSARRFGVEIEAFGVAMHEVARALTRAGIDCTTYGYNNHDTHTQWKVVTDGSLGMLRQPFELVSPPLSGDAGLAQLKTVCDTLQTLGARVSKQCGLHVHVDASDFALDDWKSLVHQFIRYEACFDWLVAPSRRDNSYAKSTRGRFRTVDEGATKIAACRTLHDLRMLNHMDRYHKLNLQSFDRHSTVEFRQHQGTIEFPKMEAWIGLVVGFVEKARSAARTQRTSIRGANGIRDFVKCAPQHVRPFLLARYAAFRAKAAGDASADVNVSGASLEVSRAAVERDLAAARASAMRAALRRATAAAVEDGSASGIDRDPLEGARAAVAAADAWRAADDARRAYIREECERPVPFGA